MRIELSSLVEPDLEEIGDYIARHNPLRAISFVREIREKVNGLALNPYIYRLRPEIGEGARLAFFGRYVILLRVVGEVVRVERVVSGYRDIRLLKW